MKALVLFSGGLDSTVLATQMKQEATETRLLSIDYGQRHAKELNHSQRVAKHLELPHEILKLPQLGTILGGSSLTDKSLILPEGHYAEESMKSTVVPNRNMILLALAGGMRCHWALIRLPMPLMPGITRSILIAAPNLQTLWIEHSVLLIGTPYRSIVHL